MVRMDENQRQIEYEQEYEKAILDSYYDEADEQDININRRDA